MDIFRFGFLAATLLALLNSPAQAANWSVQKNEQDPFDSSRSTFIAITVGSGGFLAIRCLEGTISFLVGSGPSNALAGDTVDLKIVVDTQPVREEAAAVLSVTNFATAVQFGDEATLSYVEGAQKVSVRYTLGDATSTASFGGGKSLTDTIAKARKACGLTASQIPIGSPSNTSAERSCQAQFDRMKSGGDLGLNPDRDGFMSWCRRQITNKP